MSERLDRRDKSRAHALAVKIETYYGSYVSTASEAVIASALKRERHETARVCARAMFEAFGVKPAKVKR